MPESYLFIDAGLSGTTLDRPALRRVRALIASQAIAALIVLAPDRLSRKMGKLLVLTDELQAANLPLLCVSHPIEHRLEGTLFFQMRGMIGEYERAKILERMHRGKKTRVKNGYHPGRGVPLGYRYISEPHKGRWEIDEEEAAVVRRIFTMYLDGMNIRGIAFQLTSERIHTKVDRRQTNGRKQYGTGVWVQRARMGFSAMRPILAHGTGINARQYRPHACKNVIVQNGKPFQYQLLSPRKYLMPSSRSWRIIKPCRAESQV